MSKNRILGVRLRDSVGRVTEHPETGVTVTQPTHDIEQVRASHLVLVRHLESIDSGDPAAPSLLAGWSVGHVLTHLARVADGIGNMFDGRPMYPEGMTGRNADIEAGAARSWGELVDDVTTTATTLDRRFADHDTWEGTGILPSGERPLAMIPFIRQREVEVHRVDLGLGYGFSDMPSEYIRRELQMMGMLWKARKPMGMTPLPEAALATPPEERLAWLMGRGTIEGLDPPQIF